MQLLLFMGNNLSLLDLQLLITKERIAFAHATEQEHQIRMMRDSGNAEEVEWERAWETMMYHSVTLTRLIKQEAAYAKDHSN